MPKPAGPANPAERVSLVEELLGSAGPLLPDTPVLLGEFTSTQGRATARVAGRVIADTAILAFPICGSLLLLCGSPATAQTLIAGSWASFAPWY